MTKDSISAYFLEDIPHLIEAMDLALLFPASDVVGKRQHAQSHRYGEVLYEAVEKMRKRFKTLPVRLPSVGRSPTVAARMTRSELGLSPDRPIPNVVDVLEQGCLLILALPFMLKGREGFSCWAGFEETKPVFVVSGKKNGDIRRFHRFLRVADRSKARIESQTRGGGCQSIITCF